MEKIYKGHIGEFFTKMYEANKGKKIVAELRLDKDCIAIYYKEKATFVYIAISEDIPSIEGLVKSLGDCEHSAEQNF